MEIKWGLQNPPLPRLLFVGEADGEQGTALWYEWDFDNEKQIPIFQRALAGNLTNLVLSTKQHKDKWNIKLDIEFNCDGEKFRVRAGVATMFMRCFLLALDQVEDVSKPLLISLSPGNDGKIVFCSLYHAENNEKIAPEWDDKKSLLPIINKYQHKLGVPTTKVTKDWQIAEFEYGEPEPPKSISETEEKVNEEPEEKPKRGRTKKEK